MLEPYCINLVCGGVLFDRSKTRILEADCHQFESRYYSTLLLATAARLIHQARPATTAISRANLFNRRY